MVSRTYDLMQMKIRNLGWHKWLLIFGIVIAVLVIAAIIVVVVVVTRNKNSTE